MIGPLLVAANGGLPKIPPSLPGEIGCYSDTPEERLELAAIQAESQAILAEDALLVVAINALRSRDAALAKRSAELGERVRARLGISAEKFLAGDRLHFFADVNAWRWLRPSAAPKEST